MQLQVTKVVTILKVIVTVVTALIGLLTEEGKEIE